MNFPSIPSPQSTRVLVTGHAGFIGSHVAERLRLLGLHVRGVDSLSDYYDPRVKFRNLARLAGLGVESYVLDLRSGDLSPLLDGVDAIVHLAALPGLSTRHSFLDYLNCNAVATSRLVDAAIAAGTLRQFINISTSSVYGRLATNAEEAPPAPISHYGVTKHCAEQTLLASVRRGDLSGCSLRLFSVYGPRERPDKAISQMIRCCLLGAPFSLHRGSESHTRSFTYVSDAVDAIVSALSASDRTSGLAMNIGSSEETSVGVLIQLIEELVGRKLELQLTSPRVGDQLSTRADCSLATQLLGYRPSVDLRSGLTETVSELRRQLVHC